MSSLLSIDGAFGEGGGQIIRTAVSLSAITGRPVEVFNVRARRQKPGLQPQHLAAVRAAATICGAEVTGGSVGSVHFRFEPGHPVSSGDYHFDIGTAGAAPLMVQTVLLPLALATGSSTVRVRGGTHVPQAPTAEYIEHVYFPTLRELGLDVDFAYTTAGFYPKGGGEVTLRIGGSGVVAPLDWRERGRIEDVRAHIVAANLPDDVSRRGAETVEQTLRGAGQNVTVQQVKKASPGPGAAVVISAKCESGRAGFSAVGARKLPMERVASEPCEEFLRWRKSGAPCDEHLADQLVLPLSFANAPSYWTTPGVTEHLRTVIWVVEQFLDVEARLEENPDGSGLVSMWPQQAAR